MNIALSIAALAALTQGAPPPAGPVNLSTRISAPEILGGAAETAYLKIGLTGVRKKSVERAPINLAIVIDSSSSMSGKKMEEAKSAAAMTVERLAPGDYLSVVTYGSTVRVIVPARPVRNKSAIQAAIRAIGPSGQTALFAGVSKGAGELREFFNRKYVNRLVLLSDGMANVGPSSPGELAELGRSLGKEGIAVTTFGLGLGYNEDLMAQLALASDGNHAFIENAEQLAVFFDREFDDVMSVVAQAVDVRVEFGDGARPVRVLGRDALIDGNTLTLRLNQLHAAHEKDVLLEVALAPIPTGKRRRVADVAVNYDDRHGNRLRAERAVFVRATGSQKRANAAVDRGVLVAATELIANEQSKTALALRDAGKVKEARRVLERNARFLRNRTSSLKSKRLEKLEKSNVEAAKNLDGRRWNRTRKKMRRDQNYYDLDATY